MEHKQLHALIHLLGDPDREVHQHVTSKLLSLGAQAVTPLENAWERAPDAMFQQQVEKLLHRIQFEEVIRELKAWKAAGGDDLLGGAIIVAKYRFPDIDTIKLEHQLDKIQQNIWLELNDGLTPLEKINVFNHVFYNLQGFRGDTKNFLNPDNAYINKVMEARRGNPVTLGILYMVLARRLDIPISAINLPDHLVLAHENQTTDKSSPLMHEAANEEVLFYINPFNKGAIFSTKEIKAYLREINMSPKNPDQSLKRDFFYPCNNATIILALIERLHHSYNELGEQEKVAEMQELAKVLA